MVAKTINLKKLIFYVGVTLAIGVIVALAGGNSGELYKTLVRPPLSPPSIVFPIVWNVLYILMGVAAYILSQSHAPQVSGTLQLYWIQLFVNILWSFTFWRLHLYTLSAFIIAVLIVCVLILITRSLRINRAAAWLFLPYLLWLFFALYLNIGIAVLN